MILRCATIALAAWVPCFQLGVQGIPLPPTANPMRLQIGLAAKVSAVWTEVTTALIKVRAEIGSLGGGGVLFEPGCVDESI